MLIGEGATGTEHPRIVKAKEDFVAWPQLDHAMDRMQRAIAESDDDALRDLLVSLVSGYNGGRDQDESVVPLFPSSAA